MDDLIDSLFPEGQAAGRANDFQANMQHMDERRQQRASGSGRGRIPAGRQQRDRGFLIQCSQLTADPPLRFSNYRNIAHLHLRPDGSFVRQPVETRINVPLEFISDHLNQDLERDWHMISLIDQKDWNMRQELKWLSLESCLTEADIRFEMLQLKQEFIADSSVYAASELFRHFALT